MNKREKTSLLRKLYVDIIRGYSLMKEGNNTFFIKHLDNFLYSEMECVYDEAYSECIKLGVPTEEERLKFLIETDQWTESDERLILDSESYISGLKKTKDQLALLSEKEHYQKLINDEQSKVLALKYRKSQLIGLSAEKYADNKLNSAYIYYTIYKDIDFKERLFTKEEYNSCDISYLSKLENIYYSIINLFSEKNIKKIAICPFFQNSFMIIETTDQFFGKPVCMMSFYQVDLYIQGKVFLQAIKDNPNIPDDILDDPDKILDYSNSSKKTQEKLNKNQNSVATTFFGMTKKDAQAAGVKMESITNPMKKAAEKESKENKKSNKISKPMNMMDFIKIHNA